MFQNAYINRFLTVGVFSKESPYSNASLRGKVNEWLINGPGIYDHPDRKKAIEARMGNVPPYINFDGIIPGDEITVFNETQKVSVYFPFGNTGVDKSAFYPSPAFLRSYSLCYIVSHTKETAVLQLATCGALTLWVNDEFVTDFTPLERNVMHSVDATVSLNEGINKIVVCLEELAERDTDFIFSIRYKGSQDLKILLPVSEETDTELVYKAEKALSEMFFDKDFYENEQVWLNLSSFGDSDLPLKILSDRCRPKSGYILPKKAKRILLFDKDENPSGFCHFYVCMNISGIEIGKPVGTCFASGGFSNPGGETYKERKQLVQDIIAAKGGMNEYSMLVNLYRNTPSENTDKILREHLDWIVKKKDCSDFRMIIVAYVYAKFKHLLDDEIVKEMEEAMLGYRYWCDEPGNDVMWFFSENHAIHFHVSQYIAGTSMPDALFTVSGLTGSEAADKAEKLLNEWFDSFFDEFVTEWNSTTYVPLDVNALAYLYDYTNDGSLLHEKARKALDMLAFSFAVFEHGGTIVTTLGRTYEKEIKGSYGSGMPSLLYLFYNSGYMNEHFRALTPLVIGDYEPPEEYGIYTSLSGERELIYRNTQGIDKFVNLYLYKNAKTVLSTAVDFKPYIAGYQENIVCGAIDGIAQVFINHPGEVQSYGKGRPGLWAGNGCLPKAMQYENISILHYNIEDANLIDYTHAYAPLMEFDDYIIGKDYAAFSKNGGFIGLKALNGVSLTKTGPFKDRELVSLGRENVWVIKVGTPNGYASVRELADELERMAINMADGMITVKNEKRTFVMDEEDLFVDGRKAFCYPMGVMETPIMKGM